MAPKKHDDEDEGTDWLLAQLVTGRTPEPEEQAPAPASAEPPKPESGAPESEAPAPAQPDLPLRPPSPRREEVLDWFSLAEPPAASGDAATRALPVIGEPVDVPTTPAGEAVPPAEPAPVPRLPAWSPPFVASPPPPPTARVTHVEPPVGEAPQAVEPPPGPVTPTGPFALRWGSSAPEVDDSLRAGEPAPPASEPTSSGGTSGETREPFAGFTPPVARSSFTPVENGVPRHPTAPDSAPRGWDERPADPQRPAPYDDEIWAALNEPETPSRTLPVSPVTHPGVALNLPLTPPPAEPTPPAAAPNSFAASASSGGAQPTEPQGAAPIDDLLAELGSRWAAREATTEAERSQQVAPSSEAAAHHGADDEGSFDDGAARDDEPGGEASTGAESHIARQVAEAGYFWNLTPDPTASDPNVEVSGAAATINRLAATSGPQPQGEPEPEFEWETEYSEPPVTQPEPAPEPFGSEPSDHRVPGDEPDDHDPLAALFGGAAAVSTQVGPTAPLDDPFAHLAPTTPVSAAPSAAPAQPAAAGPFPASAGAGARSAYEITDAARGGGSGGSGTGGAGTQGRRNSPARVLAWIAGSLAAVLVLTGLFFLGTQLGGGVAAPAESPSASATPTPTPEPTAAQPAGVHAWDALFGGECIEPFAGPWAEEFTVVDCATPHAAQLVYRGVLPGDAAAPFPGEAELAEQMNLLCTATGVINIAAVAGMEDLQVQASYPVNEAQWAEGDRNYYCFANRSGGEPLTASIAGPGPAA